MRGALCALAAAYLLLGCAGPGVLYEEVSPSGTLYVTQEADGLRTLRFEKNGARQSVVDPEDPGHLEMPYMRVALAGLALCEQPRRILVVGLGGGALPSFLRVHYPDAAIDAVEIDPQVLDVAKRLFGFREDARMRAYVGDGREFIEKARESSYDVIVLDAFGAHSVPRRLTTLEFLQAVRRALAPGGVAIGNQWKRPQNPLYDAAVRTYREAFDQVIVLDVEGYANEVLLALPRADPVGRDELVERAHRLAAEKRFRFDLGALVEAGYVQQPQLSRRARALRDADFE